MWAHPSAYKWPSNWRAPAERNFLLRLMRAMVEPLLDGGYYTAAWLDVGTHQMSVIGRTTGASWLNEISWRLHTRHGRAMAQRRGVTPGLAGCGTPERQEMAARLSETLLRLHAGHGRAIAQRRA